MSNTIDNYIEIIGEKSNVQGLLGFLMHTKSNIGEFVSMTGEIDVDISYSDKRVLDLSTTLLRITFSSENSPADLLVRVINKHFPDLKINGGFEFENEFTLWKDELGL
tara:strand:+ start:2933 stop:3256 length:324 start_codon:yes stop_codon:yes gene_type:complete